jgi:hypothetical protein
MAMKSVLRCLAATVLFTASPAPAQLAPKTVFHPVGPWVADYGEDYCRLSRTFSAGQSELSVALERLQPGPTVRVIVVGEGIRPLPGADQIGYAFGPAGSSGEARYVRSVMADGRPFFSLDPLTVAPPPAAGTPIYDRTEEQQAAQAITGFTFEQGLRSPVEVATGSLRAPIEALQACTDDLLAVWGLDAEQHQAMTALPVMNSAPGGVLPEGTVPYRERSKLGGGVNQVRLVVGADGQVADCSIYAPSLAAAVNEQICDLASERASFEPAKDAEGLAMASLWTGSPLDLLPEPRRVRHGGFLAGSSALGPAWGLGSPPSSAPTVTLVVPAGPPGN